MRLILAIPFVVLLACSATDNLTKPSHYLAVKPALGPHETALLISEGYQQCKGTPPLINQIGPDSWQVRYQIPGQPPQQYFFVVQISPGEARIAPLSHSPSMKRGCGMIADWIEAGKITHCEPNAADLVRWKGHSAEPGPASQFHRYQRIIQRTDRSRRSGPERQ